MKRKYAIYKSEVGLYAKEYFDKIDPKVFNDRGVLGWQYIKEENLPIVVNNVGGRCSFYPVEDNFVEIIEVDEDKDPLTREQCFPKNSSYFKYGWISPVGDTYSCSFENHKYAAKMICKELGIYTLDAQKELEKAGWVSVFRKAPYVPDKEERIFYAREDHLTKKQMDTLLRLGFGDDIYFKMIVNHMNRIEGGY